MNPYLAGFLTFWIVFIGITLAFPKKEPPPVRKPVIEERPNERWQHTN